MRNVIFFIALSIVHCELSIVNYQLSIIIVFRLRENCHRLRNHRRCANRQRNRRLRENCLHQRSLRCVSCRPNSCCLYCCLSNCLAMKKLNEQCWLLWNAKNCCRCRENYRCLRCHATNLCCSRETTECLCLVLRWYSHAM